MPGGRVQDAALVAGGLAHRFHIPPLCSWRYATVIRSTSQAEKGALTETPPRKIPLVISDPYLTPISAGRKFFMLPDASGCFRMLPDASPCAGERTAGEELATAKYTEYAEGGEQEDVCRVDRHMPGGRVPDAALVAGRPAHRCHIPPLCSCRYATLIRSVSRGEKGALTETPPHKIPIISSAPFLSAIQN